MGMENNSKELAENAAKLLLECAIETVDESLINCKNNAKAGTPVKTGLLRRKWTCSKASLSNEGVTGEVGNPVEYAEAVEYGHKTKNGGVVAGYHMLQDAMTIEEGNIADNFHKKVSEKFG